MKTKSAVYSRQRKKKYFRRAKGYYAAKKNRWRMVVQQVEKSLVHAYRDRKDRKGNFRKLWITKINALAREMGISYSRFMSRLKKNNISINRKMLADMAVHDPQSFRRLVEHTCKDQTTP
ncbi:MAG: 50S ribosomal protein L20 [Elusimicrobiota bacterium]